MNLIIQGEITDFNTFQNKTRNNKFAGASIKKAETERVWLECKHQNIQPIKDYPVYIHFVWYSKDSRKDIDNVAFAKKFILDGLVLAGVLENDSRKFVIGFTDRFYIDKKRPRIEILI